MDVHSWIDLRFLSHFQRYPNATSESREIVIVMQSIAHEQKLLVRDVDVRAIELPRKAKRPIAKKLEMTVSYRNLVSLILGKVAHSTRARIGRQRK